MQFAEMTEHVLRADLDRAAAAGMKPGRTARHDLHRRHRRAGGGQHRERIALGVEGIDLAGPGSTSGGRCRDALASARRTPLAAVDLILRPVAAEDLPDLEQRDVGEAAVGVALRRRDQAGQQARPHVGEIGRDRIGERQFGLGAAEQFGLRLRDERPGHRLDHAARRQRALGLAGAHLDRA